jgi:hypothetical protein
MQEQLKTEIKKRTRSRRKSKGTNYTNSNKTHRHRRSAEAVLRNPKIGRTMRRRRMRRRMSAL